MDQLWAPCRLAYIANPPKPTEDPGCFLCRGLAAHDDRAHLIVLRTARSAVVLNRFPYNNGHLLVAPLAHKGSLGDLEAAETLEIMQTVQRMVCVLDGLMHPAGYNIGLNLGMAAG